MTTQPDPAHPAPAVPESTQPEPDQAQLRAELDELRRDVGETVAELSERMDVPARVSARASQATEQARAFVAEAGPAVKQAARERPVPTAAVAGGVLLLGLLLFIRGRRRARTPEG